YTLLQISTPHRAVAGSVQISISGPAARFVQNCTRTEESAKSSYYQMLDQPLKPFAVGLAMAIMAIGSISQASVGIGLGVIRGSASRPRRPKLHTRPYALAGVMLVLLTACRKR